LNYFTKNDTLSHICKKQHFFNKKGMSFGVLGLIALLAISGVFVGCEEEATEDDSGGFAFELINGNTEYSISLGKAKASGEIKLPASYKKLPVTAISDNAFVSCVNMTGITIPDKVTKIGDNAFHECTSLVKVTFTGTIPANNFSSSSFPGDLRAKYLIEGIRTYSRSSGSSTTWIGTVPGIPTGLTAAAMSFNSITVSWSSVTGATGYVIYRSTSEAGTFTEVGTSAAVSYTNTGLIPSTTYYYKVAASNSGGVGGQSNAVNVTTLPLITIDTQPAATTNVYTGNISGSLSVSASVTGCATLSYQWYSNTTASNSGGTVINGATSSSYAIPTTLTAGTYYYFAEVRATGGAVSVRSNVTTVNVTVPVITINTQPAATTNVIQGNISGSLSVSASVMGGATLSYQWYSNTTASNSGGTVINGATGSSYTIPTTLTAGTNYYFVEVRATGGAVSVRSNVTTVRVMPPIEMVRIQSGTFTMGSPTSEANRESNETQHQVTISKSFYMGKYEVTQEQYQAVTGGNPSGFSSSPASGEIQGRRPVERVTWYDAVEFCNKLSAMEGLTSAYTITNRTPTTGYPITSATVTVNWNVNGYRLPTEAEWEYACRAGTTTAYNTGDTISDNTGWYDSNSNNRTHEVGLKPPNAWGLYDMHGNVYEWCWDWYGTYASGAQTDPTGAASGSYRVLRGGSWYYFGQYLRSAYRYGNIPYFRYYSFGFRFLRP